MQTFEIPAERWTGFLEEFSREHAGWPVTMEVLSSDVGPQRIARDLPLQGISLSSEGTRPSALQISVGDQRSAKIQHTVDLPLHIRLAADDLDASGTLQVEPAQGPPTLVHFHRPEARGA